MKLALMLVAAAVLTACASTSDTSPVITRQDGTKETTRLGSTKAKAQQAAITAANKQCGNKSVIVLSDSSTYNGVLDEKTGRMIEQGVGVVSAVFGKATPNLSRNDDYEYTIKFQCR